MSDEPKERWYEQGLPFSCTACGNCCKSRGEYGHVYLREEEAEAMAAHLDLSLEEFMAQHAQIDEGWITLRPGLDQCGFLQGDGRCGVYEVRPVQCRTWPFWDINLKRDTWEGEVNATCPGSRSGEVHSAARVEAIAQANEDWYEDRIETWSGLEPGGTGPGPTPEGDSPPRNAT